MLPYNLTWWIVGIGAVVTIVWGILEGLGLAPAI